MITDFSRVQDFFWFPAREAGERAARGIVSPYFTSLASGIPHFSSVTLALGPAPSSRHLVCSPSLHQLSFTPIACIHGASFSAVRPPARLPTWSPALERYRWSPWANSAPAFITEDSCWGQRLTGSHCCSGGLCRHRWLSSGVKGHFPQVWTFLIISALVLPCYSEDALY